MTVIITQGEDAVSLALRFQVCSALTSLYQVQRSIQDRGSPCPWEHTQGSGNITYSRL